MKVTQCDNCKATLENDENASDQKVHIHIDVESAKRTFSAGVFGGGADFCSSSCAIKWLTRLQKWENRDESEVSDHMKKSGYGPVVKARYSPARHNLTETARTLSGRVFESRADLVEAFGYSRKTNLSNTKLQSTLFRIGAIIEQGDGSYRVSPERQWSR